MTPSPRAQRWTWGREVGGAVGDLGTLLSLGFALAVIAGFPAARLLMLWGLVYVATGLFFRVPVSVQPLKAMAVITLAQGLDTTLLTTAAFGYGLLFLLLAVTGLVPRLQAWFRPGLVRGVQLGIALMLAQKAMALAFGSPLILGLGSGSTPWGPALTLVVVGLLVGGRRLLGRAPIVPVLAAGVAIGLLAGARPDAGVAGPPLAFALPVWSRLPEAFLILILPQLPLTLGNSVIAADDACHLYHGPRARRVSANRLTASIGISNLAIGLAGGFPVCHGAGGIAAHACFGGRTGRTTIFLGTMLMVAALVPGGASIPFLVPVPILASLLLLASWELGSLVRRLDSGRDLAVAVATGLVALATRNLAVALVGGAVLHLILVRLPRPGREAAG